MKITSKVSKLERPLTLAEQVRVVGVAGMRHYRLDIEFCVVLARDLARRGHIRDGGGRHVNGMHIKVVFFLDDVLHLVDVTTIVGNDEQGDCNNSARTCQATV